MKGFPGILYIDHFEPDNITAGAAPVVTTTVDPLNDWGKADYYQVDSLGNERMIERKQTSEALSDLNGLEEQLGRHLHECEELTLLVEGVAKPVAKGVQIYNYTQGMWKPGYLHEQPTLWSRWNAFKYSLWHNAGVHVEEVSHWQGSLAFIITWFKKAQDPTNTTLSRYIVPHMPPFHKNPHIDNLCRLKGMNIGEKTAIALIAELGSFHGVINARYSDLVGIMGGKWTTKFFEAIGRER